MLVILRAFHRAMERELGVRRQLLTDDAQKLRSAMSPRLFFGGIIERLYGDPAAGGDAR